MSAVAAMLVVSSTIVGLAWWVGDAIGPGLASIVQVSARSATAAATPAGSLHQGIAASSAPAERAKSAPTDTAKRDDANARRDNRE